MLRGGWNPPPPSSQLGMWKTKQMGTLFDSAFKPVSNCVSHDVRFCTGSSQIPPKPPNLPNSPKWGSRKLSKILYIILLYSLEVCPLNKADIRSLDFTVTRVLMKLFRTSNTDIIKDCCTYFRFKLPSELIAGKSEKFLSKLQRPLD